MSAEPKLTDADVEEMRALAAVGWSAVSLAERFGVTARHARRVLSGQHRAPIGSGDSKAGDRVAEAMQEFLGEMELNSSSRVLAAVATSLARKFDDATASSSASAAVAAPRLAGELVDVMERLRAGVPREPDAVDAIVQRYHARRLTQAAANRRNGNGCDVAESDLVRIRLQPGNQQSTSRG